jgi:hypothetical protein
MHPFTWRESHENVPMDAAFVCAWVVCTAPDSFRHSWNFALASRRWVFNTRFNFIPSNWVIFILPRDGQITPLLGMGNGGEEHPCATYSSAPHDRSELGCVDAGAANVENENEQNPPMAERAHCRAVRPG